IQIVPPGYPRQWRIDLGLRKFKLRDQPLYLRIKFYAAQTNSSGTYFGRWAAGVPQKMIRWNSDKKLAPDTFHEFQIPPNLFDDDGMLTVAFLNMDRTALLFPMEDGFEVLYREGGFGPNFCRGLLVILFWMALIAALGLAAASLLSFPVAAFFSGTVIAIAMSRNTLSTISEGGILGANHETGAINNTWLDAVLVPIYKTILNLIDLFNDVSPVDALSTGRSITGEQLGFAFAKTVLLLGGALALIGIFIFSRRELARAQGTT
ncbi:MAG TPA: hypothetical protein VGE41_14045, partial [Verrucomicrobiae bacterium]